MFLSQNNTFSDIERLLCDSDTKTLCDDDCFDKLHWRVIWEKMRRWYRSQIALAWIRLLKFQISPLRARVVPCDRHFTTSPSQISLTLSPTEANKYFKKIVYNNVIIIIRIIIVCVVLVFPPKSIHHNKSMWFLFSNCYFLCTFYIPSLHISSHTKCYTNSIRTQKKIIKSEQDKIKPFPVYRIRTDSATDYSIWLTYETALHTCSLLSLWNNK